MKKILLSIAALLFFATLLAPAKAAAEEQPVLTCNFIGQVVNINVHQSWDQYGNPDIVGWVYFGYWKFNRSQNKMEGVATHYVFATKEWLPDLRAAYFDPRRPYVSVSSELYNYPYDDCHSFFRGAVSNISVNPFFKMQENSGGGSGGGGGKGGPAGPGKK